MTVTVRELIEQLLLVDQDAEIGITDHLGDYEIETMGEFPHVYEKCLGEVYIVLKDFKIL
jgi:hypothetical protein